MFRSAVIMMSGCLFLSGCGGSGRDMSDEAVANMTGGAKETVPVSGKVTLDGKPANKITISAYTQEGGTDAVAVIETNEDGTYCWKTYIECDGLPPGSYRLGFAKFARRKPGAGDSLGGKYSNPMQNDFSLEVTSGQPQVDVNYELTKD